MGHASKNRNGAVTRAKSKKTVKLTKQAVLDGLAQGLGINEIARNYGYSSPSTINNWRGKDEHFAAAVQRLLSSPQHQRRMATQGHVVDAPVALDDKTRFLVEYRRTRDRTKACDAIGKEPYEVASWMNPESTEYDSEFLQKMENEGLRDKWRAEDTAKNKAINNEDASMLRFVLPVLSPESFGKVHAQAGKGNPLAVIFASDGIELAEGFLNRMFGGSTAADARGLPATGAADGLHDGGRALPAGVASRA